MSNSTRDHLFSNNDAEANGTVVVRNNRQYAHIGHAHHSLAFHSVRIEEF